jgi:hypothetical protein
MGKKKKQSEQEKALLAIEDKYQALIDALTGTEEEVAQQTKALQKQRDEEIAALAEKVTVKFIVPQFQFEGVVYKATEVEEAASNGDADALKLIDDLINIGAGVIEVSKPE